MHAVSLYLFAPIIIFYFFFFRAPATTVIYTLSLHDALPIYKGSDRVCAASTKLVPTATKRKRNRYGSASCTGCCGVHCQHGCPPPSRSTVMRCTPGSKRSACCGAIGVKRVMSAGLIFC